MITLDNEVKSRMRLVAGACRYSRHVRYALLTILRLYLQNPTWWQLPMEIVQESEAADAQRIVE